MALVSWVKEGLALVQRMQHAENRQIAKFAIVKEGLALVQRMQLNTLGISDCL